MIQSKEDLRAYLKADQEAYGKPNRLFIKWLTRSDEYYIRAFMVAIRHYEYWLNKKKSLVEKIYMTRVRVYLSAQNLLTIKSKKFTGVDPENANFGYPIPLNVTFGLNVSF